MKNTKQHYGKATIIIHWLVALIVFGLFALGLWMVDLTYYDSWYTKAPDLHKSIGITLLVLMIFRAILRFMQIQPEPIKSHKKIEQKIGLLIHITLYILLFVLMVSGYMISTADGRGIEVFDMFELPGFGSLFEDQEDISGVIHQFIAYAVMALVALHSIAAFKHHFIDKDETLTRMLGKKK